MKKSRFFFYLILVQSLSLDVVYGQNTFNQKEFEKTTFSVGEALGKDGDTYYGMGAGFDSIGSNIQGFYFSVYDKKGKLTEKSFFEDENILFLPGLTPEIIIQNNEAIIGMSFGGAKNQGELFFLDKNSGEFIESLVIAPNIQPYNVGRIGIVDDKTLMVVIFVLGARGPATGLFLIENKEVVADFTSSIPQFGQVLSGATVVEDGFIIYFQINEWDRDEKDPNSYYSNFILKLDKEGKEVWQYVTDQGPDTDQGIYCIGDMVVDEDGSMTMCNLDYIRYIDTLPVTRLRYKSVFYPQITKMDKDRNILWQRKMGNGKYSGLNQNRLYRIVKSHEGDGYITAGHLSNFDFRFDDSRNSDEEFRTTGMLAKVSNEGDSLWMREYTIVDYAPVDHFIRAMEKTDDGGYVMYGHTKFHNTLDVRTGDSGAEAWILKVDTHGCLVPGCHIKTSTSENELLLNVKVYPNPVSNQLYIWHSGGNRKYKLVDNSGVLVYKFEKKSVQETIILNVSHLHSGLYYLHVQDSKGGQHVEKIILE